MTVVDAVPRAIADRVAELTLDEKIRLLEGHASWRTMGVERLGIPSLYLTDGPHGVRRTRAEDGAFGIAGNIPSTCFPPAVTVANSWDPGNAQRVGSAIARECRDLGVDVLLAPGVNIKRNPLCGRNFEYFSEDPLISGLFGSAFVQGVQGEGVSASVKHFAANSNEDFRFVGDSVVDERALREIYLRQFEHIVREAAPHTVMCAYNAVNGTASSDNTELLTGILRDEWGFDGVVMTDWGATHDRVAALLAGCELDMPGDAPHNRRALRDAVDDGRLPLEVLDRAVGRMLTLIDRATEHRGETPADADTGSSVVSETGSSEGDDLLAVRDAEAHAHLAQSVAEDGAVLLTNDGTLPLGPGSGRLLVVGEMFERMRFQGAGSSLVTPTRVVSPRDAFDARDVDYRYERGYRALDPGVDERLERAALDAAADADTVLFFGGLTDLEESEGFDRTTLALGAAQTRLLRGLVEGGARVVLVLFAGAPVEIPEVERLAAVLDMTLPGMLGGEATARLLFGEVSPSGKLAESWPLSAADATSAADFDAGPVARYAESIYAGYRGYDAAGTPVRFPFGHGRSYTTFAYDDLRVTRHGGHVSVSVSVRNTGDRDGAEVVQLYVRNNRGQVFKAEKELRAFERVPVPAGGTVTVSLGFDLHALSYWDVAEQGWVLENGDYEILVAASASDIRLRAPLIVTEGRASRSPYPPEVDADYARPPRGIPASFPALVGRDVPSQPDTRRLTLETRLVDARRSLVGRIMYRAVLGRVERGYRDALALPDGIERDAQVKNAHFLVRMMPFQSLRSMAMSSAGALPYPVAAAIAALATGHPLHALGHLVRRR